MATCVNCESFVTDQYRRVFGIDGTVECCPHCEDVVRGHDGRARPSRSFGEVDQ